jgi:hypothetical protein
LTYNGRYQNLYGRSMYEPVYNDWFWYEIVLRDFLRYLQRMGVPVAVCYAPQKGMVTRPDGAEVNAMEYALLIAGYAASHSGLAMPSDTDQNGKPLWRLEYLPADQRGDQFIKALQYFATQISRGIIVGDQTATQDTEVGGFASAQVRDKNTQIDTDMIFQSFLTQIDAFWMMNYGRFNRDFNNPPSLHMVAEVLDPLERESLMKLFATAGNVKIGDGTPLDQIDWNAALRGIHAPVLTEEQIEEQRQQVLENKKEAQEMFQETQAKAAQNNGGPPQAQSRNGQQQKPPGQKLQARLDIMEHMTNGGAVPVMLTLDDVVGIAENSPAGVIDVGLETQPVSIEMQGRRPRRGRKGRATSAKASNPEFEKKHKRNASGEFAKKEEEGDEEESGDDRNALDDEPWPGADPDNGIKGVVTLDGVEYTVIGNVSQEELLATHEISVRVEQRAVEMGYDDVKSPDTIVFDNDDLEPLAKYNTFVTGNETNAETWGAVLSQTGGFLAYVNDDGTMIVDSDLAQNPEIAEPIVFHETLHTRPRDGGNIYDEDYVKFSGREETYNTILTLEYSERYGLPAPIGYPRYVGAAMSAFQDIGWDKAQVYEFARSTHKMNGEQYNAVHNEVLAQGKGAGRTQEQRLDAYESALESWYPDWDDFWTDIVDMYGGDENKLGTPWDWGT